MALEYYNDLLGVVSMSDLNKPKVIFIGEKTL